MTVHHHWVRRGQGRGHCPERSLARRVLRLAVPTLTLPVVVALGWSVAVVHLQAAGFHYATNQLFWLTALPALSAATLRIFLLALALPLVGGRRFTCLAAASLLLPVLATGLAMQDPGTPYESMVALALLCGLGAGSLASALAARFCTDDAAQASAGLAEQAVIFTRQHTGPMCWLYLGTFGSFIGFAAGLPLLLQNQFPRSNLLALAWLGPLIGALAWPLGGWLADRCGSARITLWAFVAMALGALAVLLCLPRSGHAGNLAGFLAGFGVLFAASGIGNGSTSCMTARLFLTGRQQAADPLPSAQAQATRDGNVEAAAVLGLASAIGAYGGFFIPKGYGSSIALTGSPAAALLLFIAFYISCIALTWWQYSRRHAPHPC